MSIKLCVYALEIHKAPMRSNSTCIRQEDLPCNDNREMQNFKMGCYTMCSKYSKYAPPHSYDTLQLLLNEEYVEKTVNAN